MFDLYKRLIRPLVFRLDAESAHELGTGSLRLGLGTDLAQEAALRRYASEPAFDLERFGLRFPNPLGVAAGFDKNGIVVNQLAALGFDFVEVGTVTLHPQKGNAKPRLFRLPEDNALINRLGFNNEGAAVVSERLRKLRRRCVVGVNIGRNRDVPNEEAVDNYLAAFDLVHPVADYIAVNISSPNTPGLRELQKGENLEELIGALMARVRSPDYSRADPGGAARDEKPLLVKIAPDLSRGEVESIVDVCLRLGVAGIIATNTTVSRDGLVTENVEALGTGGVSGRPLAARSNEIVSAVYRYSQGKIPIIGVGGIFTPEDAFDKIAAGASLLQVYTGFVYAGPTFARDINRGLAKILKDRGFSGLDEAVGSSV